MSEIYDNWDRLVQATLKREDDKLSAQRTPSAVSLASSSSFFERSSFEGSFNFQHIKADTDNSESVKEQEAIELFPGGQSGDKQIKPAVEKFNDKNKIREAPFWNLGRLGGKNRKKDGIELYPGGIFNFNELKASTNNFSPENKISGVGNVYKGILRDGTEVAIKKFSPKTEQGRELVYRLIIKYSLVHPNIARPMGYFLAENQQLLVYKYMGNISIEHALHGPEEFKSKLNWQTRFKICLELAKGLHFLHESMLEIIHCNIKPSNILLDKDFTVKISDFEYSAEQLNKQETAAGSFPRARIRTYMAPEYLHGLPLTPKVDVYSFGIILLEIVSGKKVCTPMGRGEIVYLLDTAYQNQKQGTLIALVDPRLGSDYRYREALTILQLAMQCVNLSPNLRPTMHEVVKILEGEKEIQSSSIPTFHWVEDPITTALSQSGDTSLEDDSDTSTSYYSTSEEIDDSVISTDQCV